MIGYYVHHQGRGHLTRMQSVAAHLRTPVVGISSLPAPVGWEERWLPLARDDDPVPAPGSDVDAHGVLHWAPRHHRGLGDRMAAIASWIATERPRAIVVDVSVEVAVLARLCGIPVVVVALPGERVDRAHRTAYDLADALLAPWPEGSHGTDWPEAWTEKTRFVGALSRFDGQARPAEKVLGPARSALVVWGAGGRDTHDDAVPDARLATPGWTWTERSPEHPSPNLWEELCAADVVITHGGQNAVADVAAARAPAVIVAQDRPYGEQVATTEALTRLGIAEGRARWPSAEAWPDLLERAVQRGGAGWSRWSAGHGAEDAAALLDDLAGDSLPATDPAT
ncbi:glycosyltransferase [Oryzobacter telluris]|uniref:glycosyltransferase n=1 Tax=Oryzobacter telluris TaxID=3149179 RepID=UPI00370D4DBD